MTFVWRQQAQKHPDRRGLARPVRPEKSVHGLLGDVQIYVINSELVAKFSGKVIGGDGSLFGHGTLRSQTGIAALEVVPCGGSSSLFFFALAQSTLPHRIGSTSSDRTELSGDRSFL